jgi:hypothetical protein
MEDVDDIYLYFQTYSYAGTLTAQGEAEAKAETASTSTSALTSTLTSAPASPNPMPQPDALFYGVALRDGAPLTSGVLTAILPRLGTVTTQIAPITGTGYNYALPVPLGYYAAGDTNYAAESARVGETVRFTVNGVPAQLKSSAGVSYQAYPIGAPGSGYAVTADISGPGSYPIGDVNVSGKRDSADALLVLKYDVGLTPGVTTWPPGPGTIYLPLCDVAEDGRCDSSDALRILMCDVGLASCPASALATADVAAVETANPAYFTVEQAADAANGELVVRVRATSPHTPLAAASLDLRYDPAQLSVVSCAENPASRLDLATCNPTSAAGMIRYTGITAGGIVETAPLIELRLHVIAPSVLAQWAPTRWAPTEGAPSGGGPAIALAVTAAFDLDGNALRPVLSAPPASDGGPRKLYLPLLILALPAAQAEPPAGSEDGAGAPPTAAPPDAISTPEPPPTIEPEPISTAAPPAPSELEPGRPEPSPSP